MREPFKKLYKKKKNGITMVP